MPKQHVLKAGMVEKLPELQVAHPNCIKLYAVYICPRKGYIVTELVTGGELLDRWGERPLKLPKCSHYSTQNSQ